jgi:hypothetical protein
MQKTGYMGVAVVTSTSGTNHTKSQRALVLYDSFFKSKCIILMIIQEGYDIITDRSSKINFVERPVLPGGVSSNWNAEELISTHWSKFQLSKSLADFFIFDKGE